MARTLSYDELRKVALIELEYLQTVVAVIFNEDDTIHDHAFTWETGENFAQQGYEVVALAEDGTMDMLRAQEIYDRSLEWYNDCFGKA